VLFLHLFQQELIPFERRGIEPSGLNRRRENRENRAFAWVVHRRGISVKLCPPSRSLGCLSSDMQRHPTASLLKTCAPDLASLNQDLKMAPPLLTIMADYLPPCLNGSRSSCTNTHNLRSSTPTLVQSSPISNTAFILPSPYFHCLGGLELLTCLVYPCRPLHLYTTL
jgi:hypothetical protein